MTAFRVRHFISHLHLPDSIFIETGCFVCTCMRLETHRIIASLLAYLTFGFGFFNLLYKYVFGSPIQ